MQSLCTSTLQREQNGKNWLLVSMAYTTAVNSHPKHADVYVRMHKWIVKQTRQRNGNIYLQRLLPGVCFKYTCVYGQVVSIQGKVEYLQQTFSYFVTMVR